MDQETRERFERIEANLETTSGLQTKVVAAQLDTQKAIIELTAAVTRYVDSATERMKTMEANLDALIRAITADHSNGRTKK
jgi:hypothetical protein